MTRSYFPFALGVLIVVILGGCASLPPGSTFPKRASTADIHPNDTQVGRLFATAAHDHPDNSAFRIISVGADGFAARMQMIDAAERTLDLQYFIFRGDETGRLLTSALLRAADRGVGIRILLDDGQTVAGDEQIVALAAHPQIEIRIFNPFVYRGHASFLRFVEFTFNASRLDYRMHNKLLVADNASALIGGRNVGDQYFQIDPEGQFADDDIFVGGPVVQKLSGTFDEYWNSALAIPVEALRGGMPAPSALIQTRTRLALEWQKAQDASVDYVKRAGSGEPLAGIISGQSPLVWSAAQVVCDSPNKKRVTEGSMRGRLMYEPVALAANAVQSELLIITPYFVPTADETRLVQALRQRNVRVRVLTNSLMSSENLPAHSGYSRVRRQLVKDGVELYEVRALLGNARGSGQSAAMSRHGNYGLHAKLFVFDRQKIFVGSMNFDERSSQLNTEVGLIINSPELAAQTATRFEAMTQPVNSYLVTLQSTGSGRAHLIWTTQEDGKAVEYRREPSPSPWRRLAVRLLLLLPLGGEL